MSPDDEVLFDALLERASATTDALLVEASWRLGQLIKESDSLRAELDMLRGDSAILNSMRRGRSRGVMGAELARHYIDAAKADGDGWRNLKAQAETTKEAADVSLVVEVTGGPPTVADLLRVLLVVEWQDNDGYWHQAMVDMTRWWRSKAARWSLWAVIGKDVIDAHLPARLPARLVPASEADADPATRGPIGGSGGGA